MSQTFQLFGPIHLSTLSIIFLTAFIFVIVARNRHCQNWVKPIGLTLAIVLLSNELIWIVNIIRTGMWDIRWGLPLHLCDLAIFAVCFSLFKYNKVIWELAYFWGLGGTIQAILTPDLQYNFPHYIYIHFFLTHGLIVIAVIYLAVGLRREITKQSIGRVFVITNIYALLIGIFNFIFKTNYMYLCEKPSQSSLLDFLGPWPFYILSLEVVLIASMCLYYLPFYIRDKVLQKKSS